MKKGFVKPSFKGCILLKILIMIKLTWILSIVFAIQLTANTRDLYSQITKIDLEINNKSLEDIIWEIKEKTEFDFFYSTEDIADINEISLKLKNVTIDEILNEVLKTTDLTFNVVNEVIIIKKDGKKELIEINAISNGVQQQEIIIKGKVIDSEGKPLPGVNIVEKGTTNGAITDLNGEYSIRVSKESSTLSFSFVGFLTEDVGISGQTIIDITLIEDITSLDEVVVVGYGTMKKANLTGAVASIRTEEISSVPVSNTSTLLQGRLPGVVLTSNGAELGNDDPEIRIRGIGTFGENDPMIIIDGMEGSVSQIASIPAEEIESISVLKDAASASIYGVRAANGVVLINTKKGSVDKEPTINFSASYTLQEPTVLPDYVNSYEWAKMYNEAQEYEVYTEDMLQDLKDKSNPDYFADTDWADEMFQVAPLQKYHLTVSGGSKTSKYMVSTGYSQQDGIMLNTNMERLNFRSNLESFYKRFTFGVNLAGSKAESKGGSTDLSGDDGTIMRYLSWYARPTVPVKYLNGEWGQVDGSSISQSVFKNPVQAAYTGYKNDIDYRLDGKTYASIELVEGLEFKTSLSYSFFTNTIKTFTPNGQDKYNQEGDIIYSDGGNNSLNEYDWMNYMWTNENLLTYNGVFGKHTLGGLLGHSLVGYKYRTTNSYIENFATNYLYELDAGTENPSVSGTSEEYSLQSFFGRVTYNYDDRYLFEANARIDGSSRMPKRSRYGVFPSFSGGWVITNEPFISDFSRDFYAKIRASWGILGNQEIGNYAYTATMASDYNYYFGDSKYIGIAENSVANEDIKWETTCMLDLGIDWSFFDNKLSFTIDWYNKLTSDILMQVTMPGIYLGALDAPYQNVGEVRNRGWDISTNYRDRSGDWNWNIGASLSTVENEIISMGDDVEATYGTNTINQVGYSIASYYGLKAVGIYRTEEELLEMTVNGLEPELGDIKYEDTDEDGNIDSDDRQIIGNPFPKFSYSFNLGASWKNFDVSMFFQGVAGFYRYTWESDAVMANLTSRWLDRWSPDNPNGSMPVIRSGSYNSAYSSFWLENSSYLRLKNLQLGYTLKHSIEKFGIDNFRIYASFYNLLTFTGLENWDPEKSSTDQRSDVLPNARSYSLGININF